MTDAKEAEEAAALRHLAAARRARMSARRVTVVDEARPSRRPAEEQLTLVADALRQFRGEMK
jgi:hypothetical protein